MVSYLYCQLIVILAVSSDIMSRPYYSRRARQHQPYTVAHPSGSEHVQSTPQCTSFRARVKNFLRCKLALSQFFAIPAAAPHLPYISSPSRLHPRSYTKPPYYSFYTYQRDTPSTVSVEVQDEPSSPTFPPNITYAPRLSCIALPWTVPLIWMMFKRMELTCPINPNECLLILQDCPLLIDFKFTLAEVERNRLPMILSVEAPALRTITVNSFCRTGPLFRSLRLPQLTSMHLSLAPLDEPPIDIGLYSLLSRSSCILQTLSLSSVFLLENELVDCLKNVSTSLEELVVRNDRSCVGMTNGRTISERTLRCLTKMGSSLKLTTLMLSPCVSTDGHLAKMLASRSTQPFNFTYSFIDPSLHTEDLRYFAEVADLPDLRLTHLLHELS